MNGLQIFKASAGSGKTYTLALYYISIIIKSGRGDGYKEILAMTFTNKAAAEMKDRILKFLDILSKPSHKDHSTLIKHIKELTYKDESEISEIAATSLHHILHNYSDLSILTLDKFIQGVIRSFAKELEFNAQFKIASNESTVISEAIDTVLDKAEKNQVLSDILESFSLYKLDGGKSFALEKDLSESSRLLSNETSESAMHGLSKLSTDDFNTIINDYLSEINALKARLKSLKKEARQLISDAGDESLWSNKLLLKGIRENDYDYSSTSYLFTPNQIESLHSGEILPKKYKGIHADLEREISRIFLDIESLKIKLIESDNIQKGLYSTAVLIEIKQAIDKIKHDQHYLFFVDFTRLASRIIQTEPIPFIYERTGSRYKHIMLDEFQDTSENQWFNLLPMVWEGLSKNGLCLIVGDEKQAIYRWRNGNVEQFIDLPKISVPEQSRLNEINLENYSNEVNELKNNYRSYRAIVDFNNQLFKRLAPGLSERYQTIYSTLNQNISHELEGYVQVELLEKTDGLSSAQLNHEKIYDIILDAKSRGYRYSDICIIIRQNTHAADIANFLVREKSLPVISPDSLRIDSHPYIQLLINYLYAQIYPKQNVYQIAIIKFYAEATNSHYSQLLEQYVVLDEKGSKVKIKEFLSGFDLHLTNVPSLKMSNYLSSIAKKFGFDASNINLQFFLDAVCKFEMESVVSIPNFINWWQDNKSNFSVLLPEENDAIKIMTIHKSKGLEFPIVIAPHMNYKAKAKDIVWIKPKIESLEHSLIKQNSTLEPTDYGSVYSNELKQSELDIINMQYVTFTRAEKEMYILCDSQSNKKDSSNPIFDCALEFCNKVSETVLSIGDKTNRETKDEATQSTFSYTYADHDQVEYNIQAPSDWTKLSKSKELEYGQRFHARVAQHFSALNKNSTSQASDDVELENEFGKLLSAQEFADIINTCRAFYPETELQDNKGELLRPDLIAITDNSVEIFEFKTGEKAESHMNQLRIYGDIIKDLGEKTVNLHLVYTRPIEVISELDNV